MLLIHFFNYNLHNNHKIVYLNMKLKPFPVWERKKGGKKTEIA